MVVPSPNRLLLMSILNLLKKIKKQEQKTGVSNYWFKQRKKHPTLEAYTLKALR